MDSLFIHSFISCSKPGLLNPRSKQLWHPIIILQSQTLPMPTCTSSSQPLPRHLKCTTNNEPTLKSFSQLPQPRKPNYKEGFLPSPRHCAHTHMRYSKPLTKRVGRTNPPIPLMQMMPIERFRLGRCSRKKTMKETHNNQGYSTATKNNADLLDWKGR